MHLGCSPRWLCFVKEKQSFKRLRGPTECSGPSLVRVKEVGGRARTLLFSVVVDHTRTGVVLEE